MTVQQYFPHICPVEQCAICRWVMNRLLLQDQTRRDEPPPLRAKDHYDKYPLARHGSS